MNRTLCFSFMQFPARPHPLPHRHGRDGAGKPIFVQKPPAHKIQQIRPLQKAAKGYRVGNQGHTSDGMNRIREWDTKNMKVKGQPELDALIKEPTREGWEYGENI